MEPTVYNRIHDSNQGTSMLYQPRSVGWGILTFILLCILAAMHLDEAVLSPSLNSVTTVLCLPLCSLPICKDLRADTGPLRYPGHSPHLRIIFDLKSFRPILVTLIITVLMKGCCYLINNSLLWCLGMKTFLDPGCVHTVEIEKKIWINIFQRLLSTACM